ncbi:probable lipid-A-disaccharide synthase, mitochondrial isoform X3 [Diospyros lotus]|uniref:probable lipid-A-disaccharide synthase, mitochondrial isoform X3 n=1 Tax=Diospyros lotus TaxID=55363 RepID=UPI0022598157|nr:probable lipid-A-disaccharide synthase, mitochondrial isoform X3 [Diospyros lotus]
MFRTIWSSKKRHVNAGFLLLARRSVSVSRIAAIDMAAKDAQLRVFIVAGEVSGDIIASRLMASLRKLSPLAVHFAGVGGSMMSKQGLKSLFPIEDIAVMGTWELLPHLNKFRVRLKETTEAALLFRPHVVVTVDSKGFSFRLLKQLRAKYGQLGLVSPAHFHYVAPSFWAWKGGEARLRGLSEFVDHVLCILPFEPEVCRLNGLVATFVGHPILEDVLELNLGKDHIENGWKLPGHSEEFQSQHGIPSGKASRVALCTSGTAAVEMQLARLPCVVAYRAHFLTEWLIRYKAKVPYISLPNILLNSSIIPEALFQACRPPELAALLMELIRNEGLQEEQIIGADKVVKLLHPSEERTISCPTLQEFGSQLPDYTPSMIAAFIVLYSALKR